MRAIGGLRVDRFLPLFVPVAALLIYHRTLAPGVLPGDSGEFQFAAWGWTLAHPTGYPLYLLLGGIWQHLIPFADPAYRLNLLSAVISATTVGICYLIFARVSGHRGAASIAAITFGVTPTFWSQATESEVYALGTLFIGTLTWLALEWESRHRFKYSAAWALVFGLSLTHHRSIILLLPAFAAFFLIAFYWRSRRHEPRRETTGPRHRVRALAYTALVVLPLLLYLYIPLRASATPYRELEVSPAQTIVTFEDSPAGWISYVSGRTFAFELGFDSASLHSLEGLAQRLIGEFNLLGAILGLVGLVVLFLRRSWELAALTVLGMTTVVVFSAAYHIGDIADYYTPAYFLFAIWIAVALGTILQFISRYTRTGGTYLPLIAILAASALLPLENFFVSFIQQDRSLRTDVRDRWESILASDLPPNAILISNDRDEMTPMWYMQLVEGRRPDTLGLFPLVSPSPEYSNVMRVVDSVIDSGRPVFLFKSMPGLSLRYRLDGGPAGLIRVADTPLPGPAFPSKAIVGDKLRVVGYSLAPAQVHPDGGFTISIYWQTLSSLDRDYTTSLQVFDGAGQKVAQGDDHPPGGDIYPTSLWQPPETLRDFFKVTLPPGTSPGRYHLFVKVYDSRADDTLGDLTEIGTLEVIE